MALVSEEQVVKVLQQYNPWWKTPNAIKEQSKPQKRFAYDEAMKAIKEFGETKSNESKGDWGESGKIDISEGELPW
jgi:hypothetical protein